MENLIYVISISSKDGKSKAIICETDIELFGKIKEATESDLSYKVIKGEVVMSIDKS